MFGKKKEKLEKEQEIEAITTQFEQLSPGQSISYQLKELFGGELATVDLNPEYPDKGKKYRLNLQELVDGKPRGERKRFLDFDEPEKIADWIYTRMVR